MKFMCLVGPDMETVAGIAEQTGIRIDHHKSAMEEKKGIMGFKHPWKTGHHKSCFPAYMGIS